MHTITELTAAEARAVSHLWRLRNRLTQNQHPSIDEQELAALIGTSVEEIQPISRRSRLVLPFHLVDSGEKLSAIEAETILAVHAARGHIDDERLPLHAVAGALGVAPEDLEPVLRDARDRLAAAEAIMRAPHRMPNLVEGYGASVGENPRSWQVMWTVLLAIAALLAGLLLLAR